MKFKNVVVIGNDIDILNDVCNRLLCNLLPTDCTLSRVHTGIKNPSFLDVDILEDRIKNLLCGNENEDLLVYTSDDKFTRTIVDFVTFESIVPVLRKLK